MVPFSLREPEMRRLYTWAREKYPRRLSQAQVAEFVEEMLDWHRGNGKSRKDWVATARNWIRKEMRMRGERESKTQKRNGFARPQDREKDKWERYEERNNGVMHPEDPRRQGGLL